ncbi:MAG: Tn7 transposase TnsA N-terminal domain-containing protein [Alteromonas stellipolaris]|uniref:TnsA endonuclease N-terminal domain-containing protein n=1 Tax=Alteromonas stellipolaris TaxID=233316 RepID=UPI003B8E1AC9
MTVQDVSSSGRSHRVLSATNGRVIHLLSDLEYNAFLYADWENEVIDIREQYPLRRDVTLSIADSLSIRHPRAYKTDMVMTTDLLIDQRSSKLPLLAIQVKPSSEKNNRRTREKILIEKRFWDSMNIDFKVVTEDNFN